MPTVAQSEASRLNGKLGGRPSKQQEIMNWLLDFVAKAPHGLRAVKEIEVMGGKVGYGWKSVQRAKVSLGFIKSKRLQEQWFWHNENDIREEVAKKNAAIEQIADNSSALLKSVIGRAEQQKHARMNKVGWKEDKLREMAQFQVKIRLENGETPMDALQNAIVFMQDQARRNPVHPAFSEDEVAQMVIEEFGYMQQGVRGA